jgi:glyoxylase-like metal-dependent hydrolase (beta-lactamase superfamily II)
MGYSGNVSVGGPANVRELPHLVISKLAVGPYENNTYLLRCRTSGEQLLIDAASEPERLLDLIGSDGLASVVTTHGHGDHWQALAEVVSATGLTPIRSTPSRSRCRQTSSSATVM